AGVLDRHDDPGGKVDRVIVPRKYRIEVRRARRDGHRARQVYECHITLGRYSVDQAVGAVIRSLGSRHGRGHGARPVADVENAIDTADSLVVNFCWLVKVLAFDERWGFPRGGFPVIPEGETP